MSRKIKGSSSIYDYLQSMGLLTNGTAEEITAAKIEYWKLMRKEWKQERRKANSSYTVFLNPRELKTILLKANGFQGGITNYLKQSGLANAEGRMSYDPRLVGKLHEAIVLHYTLLKNITEEQNIKEASVILANIDLIDKIVLSLVQHRKF